MRRREPIVMPKMPCVRPSQMPGTGSPPTRTTTGRKRPAPASRYGCRSQQMRPARCGGLKITPRAALQGWCARSWPMQACG